MKFLATILGLAIMYLVLLDAFEAMVLPRRATRISPPASRPRLQTIIP